MLIEMEKSSQAQESVVQLSSRVEGLEGNGLAIGIDNYYDGARLLSTGHRFFLSELQVGCTSTIVNFCSKSRRLWVFTRTLVFDSTLLTTVDSRYGRLCFIFLTAFKERVPEERSSRGRELAAEYNCGGFKY